MNSRAPQNLKQKLTELKGKIDTPIVDYNLSLSIIDSMARQKISADIKGLKTITQLDLSPTKHSTQQQENTYSFLAHREHSSERITY